MNQTLGIFLLVAVSLMTSFGHICFKTASKKNISFIQKFFQPVFVTGVFLFLCGPVMTSLAARIIDYSVIYSMTSINFIFILILAKKFFNENIDIFKVAGSFLIITGLILVV